MKRLILMLLALVSVSACVHPMPPVTVPTSHRETLVVRSTGTPLVGVTGTLVDSLGRVFAATSTDGGFLQFTVPPGINGSGTLTVSLTGYRDTSSPWTFCPGDCGQPDIEIAHNRPTRDQVLNIRANFIGPHDSQGRVMFSPFFASLSRPEQLEWESIWKSQGLTHILVSLVYDYPGSPIAGGDYRTHLDDFARLVKLILDDGFVPIVFNSDGAPQPRDDIDHVWPTLFSLLQDESCYLIDVPGFEVVGPGGGWTSNELSYALNAIHNGLSCSVLGVHLQPERATGASYPVEPDDPWQGDEGGFWRSNGGQFADVLLYQTPHGSKLLGTSEADGANWWGDRFIEILQRPGVGGLGWRKLAISFFEVDGYDYYHGNATDADTQRLANEAASLCARYSVQCSFGNGAP